MLVYVGIIFWIYGSVLFVFREVWASKSGISYHKPVPKRTTTFWPSKRRCQLWRVLQSQRLSALRLSSKFLRNSSPLLATFGLEAWTFKVTVVTAVPIGALGLFKVMFFDVPISYKSCFFEDVGWRWDVIWPKIVFVSYWWCKYATCFLLAQQCPTCFCFWDDTKGFAAGGLEISWNQQGILKTQYADPNWLIQNLMRHGGPLQ